MYRILYCDDQKSFLDAFSSRHKSNYEIAMTSEIQNLPEKLKGMSSLPDILLLDLYHPLPDGEEQRKKAAIAEALLGELDVQIEKIVTG